MDALLNHLYWSIHENTLYDVANAIALTTILVICDVFLRLLIEAARYNRDTGKSGSAMSIVCTMLWRGCGPVKRNNKCKRYMMSEGFSNAMAKFEHRIDEALSVFFYSLPILCVAILMVPSDEGVT